MKKRHDGWDDAGDEKKDTQYVGCGNGFFGCGKQCRITKWHKATQTFEAENYNPPVRLCIGCCNHAAYTWGIDFGDLGFLMTAIQNARAGKMGEDGTKQEVYALLEKMGIDFRARKISESLK